MPERTDSRYRVRLLQAGIVILLLIISSCKPEEKPYTDRDVRALNKWIDANPAGPSGLILDEIESGRSVIFLQENILRSDSIQMLEGIIPSLYDSGIREMGIFFLETNSQSEVDNYISGESGLTEYDVLRLSDIRLGYEEYAAFLAYVKKFNSGLSVDSRMRLTAIGNGGLLSEVKLFELLSDDVSENVVMDSTPVFVWLKAQDAGFLPASSEEQAEEQTEEESEISSTTPLVVVHYGSANGIPAFGGFIETVISSRDVRDRSFSFRPDDLPFSDWKEIVMLNEAEIAIVTPYDYSKVIPIPEFIRIEDLEAARLYFPDLGNENMPESQVRKINRTI